MTDVSELQKKLDKLIHKSFDLLVIYKKSAKSYSDTKKLWEKNLDIDEILKKIEYYKQKQKELNKVNMPFNSKAIAYTKLIEQQKKYKELLKYAKQNNSDNWLIELEKKFLKGKKLFRDNNLVLLAKIKKLLKNLKKKMGPANYKKFISKLYLNKLTDETNTFSYTVKTIMKHLESAQISENASKKIKNLNEIKSRKDIKNRKIEMEIEIEHIKLKNNLKKYDKYKKLFIDKIKKIIDKKDDDMLKQKLFKVVTSNKNENGEVVVKSSEFQKFISSKNQHPAYQKQIDKYNLIMDKLLEKDKLIRKRILKLKGIDLSKLKPSEKNSIFSRSFKK